MKRLLSDFSEIQVVDEASNVAEAIDKIKLHSPDLLFLDIQLREDTGFDLLKKAEYSGEVIFVTAWDQYALRAFEVNALDYLQKPVSPERLGVAINKLNTNKASITKTKFKKFNIDDMVFLNLGNKIRFLQVESILIITAVGAYSELSTIDGEKGLVTKALKEWEERLPVNFFVRVHRSTIINIKYIMNISKEPNYSYRIYLKNINKEIIVSRRYAQKIKKIFG